MAPCTLSAEQPRLRLLGAPCLSIVGDSGKVQLPSKAYALIALLIQEFHGSARRSVLSSRLWEDASEEKAHRNLRQLLSRIRKIEAIYNIRLLVIDDTTVTYDINCICPDLCELLNIRKIENLTDLQRVFTIYRGDLLHGVPLVGPELQNWLSVSRQQINDHFLNLVIAGSKNVDQAEADWALRRLFSDFAYDDRTCRALMQHLAQHNKQQEARVIYDKFRRDLAANLDTTPEPETVAFYKSLPGNVLTSPQLSAHLIDTITPPRMLDGAEVRQPQIIGDAQVPRLTLLKPQISGLEIPAQLSGIASSFVEDITLNLCRLRSVALIAPYSAWQLSNTDALAEAQKHNIDYAVQFFIQAGRATQSHLHMSLQFSSVRTMEILWCEEFKLNVDSSDQPFGTLAIEISGLLAKQVDHAEILNLRRTNANSAYRFYLIGRDQLQTLSLPNLRRARKSFRTATELSRHFSPALSSIARSLILEWVLLARQDKDLLLEARKFAARAIEADPFDGSGYREYGRSCLFLGELDEAIHHGQLAEKYAPHHADVLADLADTFVHNSDLEQAKQRIQNATALNPLSPDEYLWTSGGIEFFQGNYEKALRQLLRMRNAEPAYRLLSACAAMSKKITLAHEFRDKALSVHPDFKIADWVSRMPQRDPEHLELYVSALQIAGFE